MPVITSSVSPLNARTEVYQRSKTQPSYQSRPSTARPLSVATEIFDTEFEDDSDLDDEYSPKRSFESYDSRRKSQTTISSYDEAPTPDSSRGQSQRQFEIRFKPVEGPRGPHLFRSSQSSVELDFEYALQMSPLLPKEVPPRTGTALSQDAVTPISRERHGDFSIDAALATPDIEDNFPEAYIRSWNTEQVVDWMCSKGFDAPIIDCFELNDINGTALLNLQFDHLKELDIQSLGKRLEVWNEICKLRGGEGSISPQATPFQDISRPCTTIPKQVPSQHQHACQSPDDDNATPFTPSAEKNRRGRKANKKLDIITPAESVSIVAIEQLLPKPHKCNKGERCAKWRKQQRELKQLQDENGIGRFPISPTKGGHIFLAGDPGNATTANNIVPNVHKQQQFEDPFRPTSDGFPSVVASSDLLGPGQLPEFALHEHYLECMGIRDPQDNVKQFLNFQHMSPPDDTPPSPPAELAHPGSIARSESVPLFPTQHSQAYPSVNPLMRSQTPGARGSHKALPRLEIPRSASAAPNVHRSPAQNLTSACRTASPADVYRLGTPASEMDVPVTAIPLGPVARDTSQSVPPNMQFRQQTALGRSQSTRAGAPDWRRPSMALPAVKEETTLSTRPGLGSSHSADSASKLHHQLRNSDPAKNSPAEKDFGYGPDCTHAGWMKKRRTKMLRHEWQDAHFRLKGTELAMHDSSLFQSTAKDTINVDDYAVLCSSAPSVNKLSAAMKAFHIKNSSAEASKKGGKQGEVDPTAFAFQLVPEKPSDKRSVVVNGKTHHFAVKNKDDRIDWMRDLMLAKAKQKKSLGYEVEVNGIQA
ncbi:hypothetical protein LTR37_004823 [Vermiconidia calcicola]|uniref:Uncharacterized protein n=1 Tax=Vermiconidia calcicola TaxID=1690605 RepID=A0ACC3NLJ6_9PEZI|nr:hypothetical protein LTR37_004823 [Vermiconidia calcicola]